MTIWEIKMTKTAWVVQALKDSVSNRTRQWARLVNQAESCFVINDGVITQRVAQTLGISTKEAKKLLEAALKQGLVLKSSKGNYCHWWPVGYMRELKEGLK